MFYVETQNGKITGRIQSDVEQSDMLEISEDLYLQLIPARLPATFTTDAEGNIVSVTPGDEPETTTPEPTTEEMLLAAYEKIAELEAKNTDLEARITTLEGGTV